MPVRIERAVDQVYTDNTQRLLLPDVLPIEHAHVDINLRGIRSGVGLKLYTQPALPFLAPGSNGIGKGKESRASTALFFQSFKQQVVFIIEHCFEPSPAHI